MNLFLTGAFILCSIIIVTLSATMVVKDKLNPKLVGITMLLIVFDIGFAFTLLYSLLDNLHKVLGID